LLSATAYTFTVTATNASGTSAASDASNSVTVTSVPQAPNASLASPNANEDQVSFSANATGGKSITGFSGTGSVSGSFASTLTSPAAVSVTSGTNEYFTVYAINANGQSLGTQTNAVTTTAPFFPPFFPPYFPFFPPSFPYFPYFPGFGPYFPYFPGFGPYFPGFGPYFAPMPSSNPPGRYH
jgi:hypothetical protein